MDAGARLELAATGNESVMLPLHHPAELEYTLKKLKKETPKSVSKASNHKIFEFIKKIGRHKKTSFESVDSKRGFDLAALYGRLNQKL